MVNTAGSDAPQGARSTAARGLPKDFVWGLSTSSYQIEGAVHEGGRGASIWDTFSREKGRIANGDTGDVACDHYHRFGEDVRLMQSLGIPAYRFSVAWPRLLPRGRGASSETGLAFYDRLIDALLSAGIEPWLCLYHWDLPQALQDLGGWSHRDSAGWFADYAALVARRYGDRVKRFATFNEPSVFTLFGYVFDGGAPGIVDRAAFYQAVHHVNLAHGAAVDVIRTLVPGALIGAIHNRQPSIAAGPTPEDAAAVALFDAHWNRAFPDPQLLASYPPALAAAIEPYEQAGDMARICRPIDWFGFNHYSPNYVKADPKALLGFGWGSPPDAAACTGVGWHIHPDSFHDELVATYRRYRLPIYVTENGFGSNNDAPNAAGNVIDQERIDYLQSYTQAMRRAIDDGADVRGYFAWSLLDNFEWGAGYASRFGIVYVDYATQRRIPKASAEWYARLIRAQQ